MELARRMPTVFPEAKANITTDSNRTKYNTLINLDKKEVRRRWNETNAKTLLQTLKGNKFSTEVLEQHVGKLNGKFDLRGIPLQNSKFEKVELKNCDLFYADFENTDFTGSNFDGSYLSEANIKGTRFDWCKMENVFVDNVEFDTTTSFRGVDLNKINFTLAALLRNAAESQQVIDDLEANHKFIAAILKITSNYGRSFGRFSLWCIGIIGIFGLLYWLIPNATTASSVLENLYFSVLTFTTLGFGTITPGSGIGEFLVVMEVILGYFMMGLLIAILGTKVLRS